MLTIPPNIATNAMAKATKTALPTKKIKIVYISKQKTTKNKNIMKTLSNLKENDYFIYQNCIHTFIKDVGYGKVLALDSNNVLVLISSNVTAETVPCNNYSINNVCVILSELDKIVLEKGLTLKSSELSINNDDGYSIKYLFFYKIGESESNRTIYVFERIDIPELKKKLITEVEDVIKSVEEK